MRTTVVLCLLLSASAARAEHTGLFFKAALGPGYGRAYGQDLWSDDSGSLGGPIGTIDVQLGWFLGRNMALSLDVSAVGSVLLFDGESYQTAGVARGGGAITWYFQDDAYVSAAGGLSMGSIDLLGFGVGYGGHIAAGLEFPVSPAVSVGVEARLFYEGLLGWFIVPLSVWNAYGGVASLTVSYHAPSGI